MSETLNPHDQQTEETGNATKLKRAKGFRWKRGKDYEGLARLAKTYELFNGSESLATVQQIKESGEWFWYGMGNNTSHRPTDLNSARNEAMEIALENERES